VSLREDSLNTKLARLGEFDRPGLIAGFVPELG
jgi:hypothetical protein